ncbi:hypothetical protein VNI00_010954 [Paramarasmius palmivorus]|uniref:F-box domain-containing protein n=1 Tax=Paramarasmius palmivorus TaxID=297713 RepID=A0AAW0CET1_9AGAR
MTSVTQIQLPEELLLQIFEFLQTRSLLNLCLVSKPFYKIALPPIYQSISIWFDKPRRSVIGLKTLASNDMASQSVRKLCIYTTATHSYYAHGPPIRTMLRSFLRLISRVISRLSNLTLLCIEDSHKEGVFAQCALDLCTSTSLRTFQMEIESHTYERGLSDFLTRHHGTLEKLEVISSDRRTICSLNRLGTDVTFPSLKRILITSPCTCTLLLKHTFPYLSSAKFIFESAQFGSEEGAALARDITEWARGQGETGSLRELIVLFRSGSVDSVRLIDEISSTIPSLEHLSVTITDFYDFYGITTLKAEAHQIMTRVGDILARMPKLRELHWSEKCYGRHTDLSLTSVCEDMKLVQLYGEKCPSLMICEIPGVSYAWTRIVDSAWVPHSLNWFVKLLDNEMYPALGVLLHHAERLSTSPDVTRFLEQFRLAETHDEDSIVDLIAVMVYLDIFEHVHQGRDYKGYKGAIEYASRIRRILPTVKIKTLWDI